MKLVFAVLFALACYAKVEAVCDQIKLNACTDTFRRYINYPTQDNSAIWKDYQTFINYTDTVFTQNVGSPTGLLNICNALEQLKGCVYPNDCFTPFAFLERQASPVEAFIFSGLFQEYNFRCGPGFYTILRENFPCVQRVVAGHSMQLSGCLTTYVANLQHDMQNACTHVQNYMVCVSAIFNQSACGFAGSTDHWWACESAYQLTQPGFPNCKASCANGGPTGLKEFMAENTKIENGQFWLKPPQIFKNINGKWRLSENEWVIG
jgi:hypothetical protein